MLVLEELFGIFLHRAPTLPFLLCCIGESKYSIKNVLFSDRFPNHYSGFRQRGLANCVSPFFVWKWNGKKKRKETEKAEKNGRNGNKRKETERKKTEKKTEENGKKTRKKRKEKRKKTKKKGKNRKRHRSGDPFCDSPIIISKSSRLCTI